MVMGCNDARCGPHLGLAGGCRSGRAWVVVQGARRFASLELLQRLVSLVVCSQALWSWSWAWMGLDRNGLDRPV